MTQVNEGREIEYMTLKSNKFKSCANFRTKYEMGQALVFHQLDLVVTDYL